MDFALLLGAPLAGALILALIRDAERAMRVNVAVSTLPLMASLLLAARLLRGPAPSALGGQLAIDSLSTFLLVLTALVALSTAVFSRGYMRIELAQGRLNAGRLRLYHALYQLFLATMLLCLSTDNLGLLWVSMEAATLCTVLLVTLYRSPASLAAGWKYFILCGVGIAQALFGTILLYVAAQKALGSGGSDALLWTRLAQARAGLEPTVVGLAFVFLLVGYGTKAGLAPLHAWLPDAYAESPVPVAVLIGLLPNVALYAVLRVKTLAEGSLHAALPGHMLMGFGLVSVGLAALMLWRQRDVKRLLAYSSVEHMGLATFAFGLGGAAASFAALLHLTVHTLTKSALFFAAGRATQHAGSPLIERIRGLRASAPRAGLCLLLGALAILGLPPSGLFASEFLILVATIHRLPWIAPLLLVALAISFAAILSKVQLMVFGETQQPREARAASLLPALAHLILVAMLGLYVPPLLARCYGAAAHLLGGG